MDNLIAFLKSLFPISEELEKHLADNLILQHVKKNQHLLCAGDTCKNIYFIKQGLVRSYYTTTDGKEVSSWFMKEGDVIISVESFFLQKPSYEYLVALEDTIVFFISFKQLQLLYKHFIEFNVIGRILTENYYILSEQRLFALRMKTAKEKYDCLMQIFPQLILRVPSKYLASYLGISAETLSRIKGDK